MAIMKKKRAEAKETYNTLVADIKDNGVRATVKDRGVKGFIKAGISEPVMALIIVVFSLALALFILYPLWQNLVGGEKNMNDQVSDRFDQLLEVQDGHPDPKWKPKS